MSLALMWMRVGRNDNIDLLCVLNERSGGVVFHPGMLNIKIR